MNSFLASSVHRAARTRATEWAVGSGRALLASLRLARVRVSRPGLHRQSLAASPFSRGEKQNSS